MEAYEPSQLEVCQSKGCEESATVIIHKTMETEDILFSYCGFHAVTANIYFGHSPTRHEVKGITPC